MKLYEILNEAGGNYNMVQRFVIQAWGRLLYLNYEYLQIGMKDWSDDPVFLEGVKRYMNASEEEREEELDEWVSDGMKGPDGKYRLNCDTIDSVLHSCETPLEKDTTLYRFTNEPYPRSDTRFKWMSMTTKGDENESSYSNNGAREKHVFNLPKGTKVVLTHGLADHGEVIASTEVLRHRQR